MIQLGDFINGWCILKPSGVGAFECSNGKKVIRVSIINILKGKFEGDLMYNIIPKPVKEEVAIKKKIVKSKPQKKVSRKKSTKKV